MVTLRGAPEHVAQAKESIKQLLEEALAPQEGEVEERISCPAGIVGRIIGRGGETIRCVCGVVVVRSVSSRVQARVGGPAMQCMQLWRMWHPVLVPTDPQRCPSSTAMHAGS